MRIYVASSWRNECKQQAVVQALRKDGHEVYDFRNPKPGDHGFGWRQCATPEQLKNPLRFRDEVLTHPVARAGFDLDMSALCSAEVTVLVLPCGRSAHLELGYAIGALQRTIVFLDDPISEPELMYLACSTLVTSMDELRDAMSDFSEGKDERGPRIHVLREGQSLCPMSRRHGVPGQWPAGHTWLGLSSFAFRDAMKRGTADVFCEECLALTKSLSP
jgi:hypothetical protein